jgi:hypothetical protein
MHLRCSRRPSTLRCSRRPSTHRERLPARDRRRPGRAPRRVSGAWTSFADASSSSQFLCRGQELGVDSGGRREPLGRVGDLPRCPQAPEHRRHVRSWRASPRIRVTGAGPTSPGSNSNPWEPQNGPVRHLPMRSSRPRGLGREAVRWAIDLLSVRAGRGSRSSIQARAAAPRLRPPEESRGASGAAPPPRWIRRAFRTTRRPLPTMASAAHTGVRCPVAARGISNAL